MIQERLTCLEELILGGRTWATESMSFAQRLRFYRDTGEWPGLHSKEVTQMFMQSDIDAEIARGSKYCAERKLTRAREAGLEVE